MHAGVKNPGASPEASSQFRFVSDEASFEECNPPEIQHRTRIMLEIATVSKTIYKDMKSNINGAALFEVRSITDSIGIHHIDADAGFPASPCQTPAFAGVKPLNTNSHEHVCIN